MTDAHWKIGELAKRTGVSIRTLHHYDDIGLLAPPHRTVSGHRLYGRDEVVRLQQILSLRQMGFSLEQIGELLARRDVDAQQIIRAHIARLRQQIAAQQDLCTRLEAVASHYDSASAEEFIQAIEVMQMFDKYYTKEQLDTLAQRREQLGEDTIHEVQQEWPRLIAAVKEEMQRGTDPRDPKVQALAKRWNELIAMFTGGDTGILQSLKNLHANEPQVARQNGLEPGMSEYIQRASQ